MCQMCEAKHPLAYSSLGPRRNFLQSWLLCICLAKGRLAANLQLQLTLKHVARLGLNLNFSVSTEKQEPKPKGAKYHELEKIINQSQMHKKDQKSLGEIHMTNTRPFIAFSGVE